MTEDRRFQFKNASGRVVGGTTITGIRSNGDQISPRVWASVKRTVQAHAASYKGVTKIEMLIPDADPEVNYNWIGLV